MARSKKSTPIAAGLEWRTNAGHMVVAKRDGMTLGIVMSLVDDTGRWQLLAIETPTPKRTKNTLVATQAVLDKHSHKLLGEYPIVDAFKAAESYALAWLGHDHLDPTCACDEIGPPIAPKRIRTRNPPARA